jgi:hypothetical protein
VTYIGSVCTSKVEIMSGGRVVVVSTSVTTVLSEWTHPAVPGSDVSKQRTYR